MFFILMYVFVCAVGITVLIPLDQGCFLFGTIGDKVFRLIVLIPLDQGCFLFPLGNRFGHLPKRLNPFGSGMFFILPESAEMKPFDKS